MSGRACAVFLALLLLAACSVGPDYHRPPAPVPTAFKEAAGWKIAEPNDAAPRGPWWSIYRDPVLDQLERQVEVSNQNLKAAEASYRQAVALVAQARAGFFPVIDVTASVQRSGSGTGSRTSAGTATAAASATRVSGVGAHTLYDLAGNLTWTIDVWGRIRRLVEADVASAQASAADLAGARLSAQAQLATAYFDLRIADEVKRVLDADAVGLAQSLEITRNQYRAGIAAQADVIQAQTQLETTQSQAINVGVQRAQFEHAIAVLTGKPPAEVTIAPAPLTTSVPVVPPGMPSTLLERRPDIAAAERLMAAANAQIGVTEAAYYPNLTLSATVDYSSFAVGGLLSAANRFWSFGGQLAQTLFNGGLRGAELDQVRAAYDQNVAVYRQTVLTGFQQVEDELAALRILEQQAQVQAAALRDAQEAVRLVLNQYRAGTVPYTSVITAQTTAFANEQTALTIMQNRLLASVALIQALGGGWDTAQLPSGGDIKKRSPLDLLR